MLATKGPDRGKAKVYIDEKLIKEIDLYSSSLSFRNIVFQKAWSSSANHSIKIEVSGTKNKSSSSTKIDIDGIAIKP